VSIHILYGAKELTIRILHFDCSELIGAVSVSVFSMITVGLFALIGMSLFGGKMFRCTSLDIKYPSGKIECSGFSLKIDQGFLEPRSWVRPNHNFDTAYFAFL
jgi:hypothetical protein